ncbi:MAG: VOC family protein [Bacteroidota bacterium]
MHQLYNTFRPDGFTSVNSYLFTEHPSELILFLKEVFYAEELSRVLSDDGTIIRNCILKIGDTCIMIAQASGQFLNMRTALYLYVNDVDGTHARALSHGAKEIFSPTQMDYGDYQGGVEDVAGNCWWISQRVETTDY